MRGPKLSGRLKRMTLPAIPVGPPVRRGMGARRMGLGDQVTSIATGAWNSTGANGVLTSVLQGMPPDVIAAMGTGSKIIQGAGPALDLAGTISTGGVPSEQEVVAGLAAVAGLVNPAAGAIMAAGGEILIGALAAMQSIFAALGLYSKPDPAWTYVGLHRALTTTGTQGDPIPAPPNAATGEMDPNWLSFPDYLSLLNFLQIGAPITAAGHQFAYYNPDGASANRNAPFIALYETALLRRSPLTPAIFGQIAAYVHNVPCYGSPNNLHCNQYIAAQVDSNGMACCPWCNLSNSGCYWMGPPPAGQSEVNGNFSQFSPTPFEQYFNTLLVKNLEYWANAQPFVPLRTLLAAAVTAWNTKISATTQICYEPANVDLGQNAFGGPGYGSPGGDSGPIAYKGSTISYLLGPYGGLTDTLTQIQSDQPKICVNAGQPRGAATSTSITGGTTVSALTKAAVVAPAGIAGGAAVGALAYSWVAGESFGAVVRGAWGGIVRFAETFGRRY